MEGLVDQADFEQRGNMSRAGITLLNLILPGLGLLRLGRVRPALGFMIAQLVAGWLVWLRYVHGPVFTFETWVTLVVGCVGGTLAIYLGSLAMTWRASRDIELRAGRLWRWYGLLAVGIVMVVMAQPLATLREYYRTFSIQAESMLPIMRVGDLFIAQGQGFAPLRRGDVVIVRKNTTAYVKRIVAIPGDHISMTAGQLILDGHPITQRRLQTIEINYNGGRQLATVYDEQFPGETRPHQIIDITTTPQDDWAGVELGPDQYILLGDNRDNSLDSRFPLISGGFGTVMRNQIEARALFRYWRRGTGLADGAI